MVAVFAKSQHKFNKIRCLYSLESIATIAHSEAAVLLPMERGMPSCERKVGLDTVKNDE
jgi:hypothetical protein